MAITLLLSFMKMTQHNRCDVESFYEHTTKKNTEYVSFNEAIEYLTNGATPLREDLSIGDVSFFTAENIMDMYIDKSKVKKIRYDYHTNHLKRSQLKELDLLISIKGKIGTSVVVVDANGYQNINQDVAKIILKQGYNPFIYSAYFATKYGKEATKKVCTGQINPFLGLGNIKTIQIPLFSNQLSVATEYLIRSAVQARYISEDIYHKAELILLKILECCQIDGSLPLSWIISHPVNKNLVRLDPEFWHPKFERLKQQLLEKNALEYISNLLVYNSRGLQPDYINDGEILVVNSQHLGSQHVDIDSLERTNQELWDNNPRSRIFKNDILLYTTGAYLGRTNIWLKDQKAIASNHVNILRVDEKKCNPVYLAFFLNSDYGIMQSKRWQSGSGQQEIYPNDIGQMMVYLPSRDVQDEIAECVVKSYYQLRESKRLLEVAKKAVEIAIEESEEKAMQYLNGNQATNIEY